METDSPSERVEREKLQEIPNDKYISYGAFSDISCVHVGAYRK